MSAQSITHLPGQWGCLSLQPELPTITCAAHESPKSPLGQSPLPRCSPDPPTTGQRPAGVQAGEIRVGCVGRTLPPLQEIAWIGRGITDLLTKPRSPGSLSAPLSSKLEGCHFEINEGSPVKSQLGGDQGRRRSDSMGVMAQDGGKPAAVSGLGTQPPPLHR